MVAQKIETKTYGNKKKSFTTAYTGQVTEKQGDNFVKCGSITVGNDDQDRARAIINIGDKTYGAFLNPPLTEEQKDKMRKVRSGEL